MPTTTLIATQWLDNVSITPDQVALQFTQVSVLSPQVQGSTQTQITSQTQSSTQTQEYIELPTQLQEYLKKEQATLSVPSPTVATTSKVAGSSFDIIKKERHERFLKLLRANARKGCSTSSKSKYHPSDRQLLKQDGRYMNGSGLIVEVDTSEIEARLINNPPDLFFGNNGNDEEYKKERFELFIDREEVKVMAEEGEKLPPAKKRAKKDSLSPEKICSGCGKPPAECDDVIYGEYCREAVITYHYMNPVGTTDNLTGKRIFINKYNNASEWEGFKHNKSKCRYVWKFPPSCLKVNSYYHIIHWLEWTRNDKFMRRGEVIPYDFCIY